MAWADTARPKYERTEAIEKTEPAWRWTALTATVNFPSVQSKIAHFPGFGRGREGSNL